MVKNNVDWFHSIARSYADNREGKKKGGLQTMPLAYIRHDC
jgi:hypothetical protein